MQNRGLTISEMQRIVETYPGERWVLKRRVRNDNGLLVSRVVRAELRHRSQPDYLPRYQPPDAEDA